MESHPNKHAVNCCRESGGLDLSTRHLMEPQLTPHFIWPSLENADAAKPLVEVGAGWALHASVDQRRTSWRHGLPESWPRRALSGWEVSSRHTSKGRRNQIPVNVWKTWHRGVDSGPACGNALALDPVLRVFPAHRFLETQRAHSVYCRPDHTEPKEIPQ